MEDLMISNYEHDVLQKNKAHLESRYKVKLNMPEATSSETDLIFANIVGQAQGINSVKRFLKRKVDKMRGKEKVENNASVIILDSDSDSGPDSVLSENINNKKKKRKITKARTIPTVVNLDNTLDQEENESPETVNELNHDESVIILETNSTAQDFIPLFPKETNEVINCSNEVINCSNEVINSSNEVINCSNDVVNCSNDVIEISSDEDESTDKLTIEKPIPRKLRPVVIDGSNVARSHGKPTNTYSCKGIKISVDYFLQRGHPQVTAFVPLFRRHGRGGFIETTDQNILEELEKTQNVVFTPSRKVDGKRYTCYDDRFIVELAVKNGGVILSNDNFKDIMSTSPEHEETIKKRLLMYCFVGDILMLPEDPLGRTGPNLAEYLSFPAEESKS